MPIVEALFPADPEANRLRYKLLVPEAPLSESAHEARILGFDPGADPEKREEGVPVAQAKEDEHKAATWKEIVISKLHGSVMVFNWIPYGRRLYRSLAFCSKPSVALHNLALDTADAQKVRGAGGIFGDLRAQEGSLCILRVNKGLGVCEQYVSPRLLRGVIPSALLESYSFWEGEDGIIRGMPMDEQSAFFSKNLVMELEVVSEVVTNLLVRRLPGKFPKATGEFKGLQRPEAVRTTAESGRSAGRAAFREADVLQLMELGFSHAGCRLALEKSHGDSAAAAEWLFDDGNTMAIFAADSQSTAMAVDGDDELQQALLASMEEEGQTESDAAAASAVAAAEEDVDMDLDSSGSVWTLMDLHSCKPGSDVALLTQLLVRIEDLSHVLVWAECELGDVSRSQIAAIELPRLKLTLVPHGGTLAVKDSGGWFVKSGLAEDSIEGSALGELLRGIDQALVLENGSGELRVLLPNHDVGRPDAKGDPFTTTLVFNRSSFGWQQTMDSPYYLYPVHTTQAFVQSTSLAASLYLVLLRLMVRDYAKAFVELESCWTDTPLLPEEQWVFNQFGGTLKDGHPDAHAVRCKLALSTAFVDDLTYPFDLHDEVDRYLAKRHHVSRELWLSEEEELQLLRLCKSSTARVKARLEVLGAQARGQASTVLRTDSALHGGQPWSRLCCQSSQVLGCATRITRLQFRHPALGTGQEGSEWPDSVDSTVLMKMLWEDTLLQDDESGVNRQLGFVFLYMVLLGQLSLTLAGADVTGTLGLLLARVFHLKLARWGKEITEDGESEPRPSLQMATIALLSRSRDGPVVGWPVVPTAVPVRRALSIGQNLYDAQGRESPLKFWLDAVDQTFQRTFSARGIPAVPAQVPLDDWAPPLTVQLEQGTRMSVQRLPRDDHCTRREVPAEFGPVGAGQAILAEFGISRFIAWERQGAEVSGTMPFNLSRHSSARSAVAQDLLGRLAQDCERYAATANARQDPVVCGLSAELMGSIVRRVASEAAAAQSVLAQLQELEQLLLERRSADHSRMRDRIATVVAEANAVQSQEGSAVFDYLLRRDLCSLERRTTFEYLTSCVLSTAGADDLQALNPHSNSSGKLLDASVVIALLAGRLQLASRAADQCRQLAGCIRRVGNGPPRPDGVEVEADLATMKQLASTLGETIAARRCYLRQSGEGSGSVWFDPRFLIFEYLQKIVLRPRQFEMVDWFVESYRQGQSRVQQMIMGAGKTTVVGPLLSMMLASNGGMVTQVMPGPLLDQTRQILRTCFSTLIPKRIVTFQFDRQVEDCPETVLKIFAKLEACRATGGVVCSTPEAIKSMLLKFIEQLQALATFDFATLAPGSSMRSNRELARQRDILSRRSDMADAVVRVVKLWRHGVVIMDEALLPVDVLLHPLKSELNFPIGFRDPIDLSGHRWNLPIHIMDGTLFAAADGKLSDTCTGGTVCGDMLADASHPGHEILSGLQQAIQAGYAQHALQRTPHAVLLDLGFYHKSLQQHYARWILLWLKGNFVGGCSVPDDVLLEFMQADLESAQKWRDVLERGLTPFSLKLLNLACSWTRAILPHVLSKIDRVSYGLLGDRQLKAVDAKAPFSRLVMAVPFVGKDVPSRSSEFAHPDVAIGLTVLAYRYEGLRPTDVRSIVAQLKQDCSRQLGPRDSRPAHVLFESWVRQEMPTSPRYKMRRIESSAQLAQNILPLSLFQPTDAKQMARLYKQLQLLPSVSHFWLRQHVFPVTMNFHPMKVSASGHELGSSLLFGHRVGFSGTPSNLLPLDLGECFYEPGSDGQIMHVLTDPRVTSAEVCVSDWTPSNLLLRVSDGSYHALIDTGALITNMDNEQVARELLAQLPSESFDGVVFLDPSDRKMILLRSSTGHCRAVALVTSGVVPERRFTFFDQVHTTGMDILTSPCAKAVVTIGKDMNFRDYAQGSYRMRKVGKGQTIHLCVIPEVETRIAADLGPLHSGRLILDVPAWLLVNSCKSESVQSLKLLSQELANGWRKRALEALTAEVVANGFEGKQPTAERMRRFEPGPESSARRACLGPFQDKISFAVEDKVAQPSSYRELLQQQCEEHSGFCISQDDRQRQQRVLDQVEVESQVADHKEMQYGFSAEVVHEQEAEQQQEQEEEQEEEQENSFTRDDEQANPWRADVLVDSPTPPAEGDQTSADRPFYRLAAFRARPEQPLLAVDKALWLTDNFFRPAWVGTGDRRLKTAYVVLEWHPELSKDRHKRGMQARMRRFFAEALAACGGNPTQAAIASLSKARDSVRDEPLTQEELAGAGPDSGAGQSIVAVTLAEAETLRWIIRSKAHPVAKDVGFALRMVSGRPLDQSPAFVRAPLVADEERLLCVLRLFNSDMFLGCSSCYFYFLVASCCCCVWLLFC
ncbi:unnamed protein product [Polarella glacialis]|uniref:ubiquitinyl hydrolase 1 n=1 Tax=Polarella glacialis TaxID=89957 RepID=A0A813G519_POLGL|nr:unnamed protein product [Polarella glacialis]